MRKIAMIFITALLLLMPMLIHTPVTAYAAAISPTCARDPEAAGCAQQIAKVQAQNASSTTTINTIVGVNLFSRTNMPIIGNYMFDSNGWQGNFDPIYWIANLLFAATVGQLYVALEFFKIGSSMGGLDPLIKVALSILHNAYAPMMGTVIPLASIAFVGVFIWFGVMKHDIHAVAGRGMKSLAVIALFAALVSPNFTNSQVLQIVSNFPVSIGNYLGGTIDGLFSTSTTGKVGSQALAGASVYDKAWDTLVIPEWIAGEEGANYDVKGLTVVSTYNSASAWRYILGYPLQNSMRNGVVGKLQATKIGPTAFSSGNRIDVATVSFFGNLGPVIYFLVMGLVMLFARIAFIGLVAAGAIILPLELFPVTRSMTVTLKWIQYMLMTLFVMFFVSVYSSILFGLDQLTEVALNGSVFSHSAAVAANGGVNFLNDFVFLGNGLAYLIAILIAYWLYKKMKPMQKIKSITDSAAARAASYGSNQRLTAEERIQRRSPLLRGRNNIKRNKSLASSDDDDPDDGGSMDDSGSSDTPVRRDTGDLDEQPMPDEYPNDDDWNMPQDRRSFHDVVFEAENGERRLPSHRQPLWLAPNQDAASEDPTVEAELENREHPLLDQPTMSLENGPLVIQSAPSTEWQDPFFAGTEEAKSVVIDMDTTKGQGTSDKKPSWQQYVKQQKEVKAAGDKAVAKTVTGSKKAVGFIRSMKILASPDQAMDAVMGGTLGFAAGKISSAGKGIALKTIRNIAESRAARKTAPKLPKAVKPQTKPITKKARKHVDMTTPDQGYAQAYQEAVNNAPPSSKSAPAAPSPDRVRPSLISSPQPSTPPTTKATDHTRPNLISSQRTAPQVSPASQALKKQAPTKEFPTLKLRQASVKQIKQAQQRRTMNDRTKRVVNYTRATLPTAKEKPSLRNWILGDRR